MQIENSISKIVEVMNIGEIICIPTDTLFALSCNATNPIAVGKLYDLKRRNKDKKLPVFFRDLEHVKQHCELPEIALKLANEFWPGKLTMILKLRDNSNIAMNAFDMDNSSVATRVPGDKTILSVINLLGDPIIGTSANISGDENINSYDEIEEQFKNASLTIFKPIDHKFRPTTQSTIISFDKEKPIVLRSGAISEREIMSAISFCAAGLIV